MAEGDWSGGEVTSLAPTVPERRWDVLVIGGASGTGKTSISYRLARDHGVGITEFDDVVEALKAMTTPSQQPALHYWDTHPEAMAWTPQQIVDLTQRVWDDLLPAAQAVVANHLDFGVPLVLEGDYLLPRLVTQAAFGDIPAGGRVHGVFLVEDEEQIAANLRRREPDGGDMTVRARVSWLLGEALREECERTGVPALNARPWPTLAERIRATLP
jgi:2-phosphoglycerate kinase